MSINLPGMEFEGAINHGISPLPGQPGREPWQTGISPCGPVGIFVKHLHYLGSTLHWETLAVRSSIVLDFYLLHSPWDGVITLANKLSTFATINQATQNRSVFKNFVTIQPEIFHAALKGKSTQHVNIVHAISTFWYC